MAGSGDGWWAMSLTLAVAVLHDRTTRRRVMMWLVVLLLGIFAFGVWAIDDWLLGSPLRFLAWWGGCGALAVFVLLFALYDVLAVVREERERFIERLGKDDSACDDDQ